MSDAYAMPSGWTAGNENRSHRGPHHHENQHQDRQERSQERAARREGRREAFRAVMALKAAMADDSDVNEADEGRRGRRGGPRRGGPFGRPGFGGPGFDGPRGGRGGRGGRGRARRGDVRSAILTLLAEEPRNGYGVIQEIEERSNGVWKPSPGAVYPALQQLEDEGLVAPVEVEGRKLFELTAAGREYVETTLADAPAPWAAVAEEAGTSYRDAKHQLAQVWHAYAAVAQDGNPEQLAAASKVLTDEGRAYVESTLADAPAPWASVAEEAGTGYRDAKHQFAQIWHAYAAVHQDGTPEQIAAASKVLGDARRSLYRILAEDDDEAVGAAE